MMVVRWTTSHLSTSCVRSRDALVVPAFPRVSIPRGRKNSTEDSFLLLLACCAPFVISGAVQLIAPGVVEGMKVRGKQMH